MQSIIVYRNPLEAAIWESLASINMFPIIVGIVVFISCAMISHNVVSDKLGHFSKKAKRAGNIALFGSAFIAAVVWYIMEFVNV